MPTPDRTLFGDAWVRAWNAHDVDAVLAHFRDDVVFTSPVAGRLLPETAGVVRGKTAVRDYWVTALTLFPDLHFELIGVYQGESLLVINYRNERGGLVNEVLMFDGDLVREGHGTYM
jgi:ketosteroid isomerase-like protein